MDFENIECRMETGELPWEVTSPSHQPFYKAKYLICPIHITIFYHSGSNVSLYLQTHEPHHPRKNGTCSINPWYKNITPLKPLSWLLVEQGGNDRVWLGAGGYSLDGYVFTLCLDQEMVDWRRRCQMGMFRWEGGLVYSELF